MTALWKFEEKVYRVRGLVEVMADGLSNDVVGINNEHYAATLSVVRDLVEEMEDMINLEYEQRRREKKLGEYAEDGDECEDETDGEQEDEDSENSLFGGASLFSGIGGAGAQPVISFGNDFQSSEPESGEEREEGTAYLATGSLGVKLVEEHDDGSATFEVHGDKDQMGKLFSAFFTEAIVKGIDCTQQSTERWVLEKQIVKKAREFADLMMQWEWEDELDYDPQIRKVRVELTDLFIKYGAER